MGPMGRRRERWCGCAEDEYEAYAHLQEYGTRILGITIKYHEQRSGGSKQ